MISSEGDELHIGDIPITRLVEKYGEPLYLYDLEVIQAQYKRLRAAIPDQVEVFYSMKANPNLSIVAFLQNLCQGAEVSSLRELYVAQQANFSPERILFVGPSKSAEEIAEAIRAGIFCLAVESQQELELANELARKQLRIVNVAIRINPAFDATGSKLKMGGTSRQFGIDEEVVEPVLELAGRLSNVKLLGIHVYLGTRILNHEFAWKNVRYVIELGQRLAEATGIPMQVVDFGGGLGVPYFAGEGELDLEAFGKSFREYFSENKLGTDRKRYVLEAGRFLVAESGIYVTRARYVKESRGQRYVLVSGGMNHHQATTSVGTLVKNHFPMEVLNKVDRSKDHQVQVCGPLCTPSDVLGKSVSVPQVEPGDLIGLLKSGAYGLTASPVNFLSHAHPAEVMVYKGRDFLIRRASTTEDVLRGQILETIRPTDERARAHKP